MAVVCFESGSIPLQCSGQDWPVWTRPESERDMARLGAIRHWIQSRLRHTANTTAKPEPETGCGCNNIISSSANNLRQLEPFFCQFWPSVCENSLLCDINHNSLPTLQQDTASQELELHSTSIASSSLMLIIPEERSSFSLFLV